MQYIRRHWLGECSLAWAFWVNVVTLNLVVTMLLKAPITFGWIEYPVYQSRLVLIGAGFAALLLFPWQVVGLVRASHRVWVDEQKRLGPVLVVGVVLLSCFNQVQTFKAELPTYRELWSYGFRPDPLANYQIDVLTERNLIRLEGFFGFGMTREIEEFVGELDEPGDIEGIVLDSGGGRLYEGRALAELIDRFQWDTYSSVGCNSACPLAFVAGTTRTLAQDARLGFHQYVNTATFESLSRDDKEYALDRRYYLDRGIDRAMVDRMFETTPESIWLPSLEELEKSNLIHGVVSIEQVLPEQYRREQQQSVRTVLNSVGVFKAGARLMPDFHGKLVNVLWREKVLNGPEFDLIDVAPRYFDDWAMLLAGQAGNADLTSLLSEMADLLITRPEQCLKMVSPERHGNLDFRVITTVERWHSLNALFSRIVERTEATTSMMEPPAFQAATERIRANMGDNLRYLDKSTHDDAEVEDVCRAYSQFFREILALPKHQGPAFYRRMRFNNG